MTEINYEILIGSAIKNARCTKGFSQEKLAELAGIDRSYVSEIERGIKSPTINILSKICKALSIDLKDLFS